MIYVGDSPKLFDSHFFSEAAVVLLLLSPRRPNGFEARLHPRVSRKQNCTAQRRPVRSECLWLVHWYCRRLSFEKLHEPRGASGAAD